MDLFLNDIAKSQCSMNKAPIPEPETATTSAVAALDPSSRIGSVPVVRPTVLPGTIVHADEAPGWGRLHAYYEMRRINHSVAFSKDGACTNMAKSYFSRLRRAEVGQHHHISNSISWPRRAR